MTETLSYLKNTLKGLYPPEEINGIIRLIMEEVCHIPPHRLLVSSGEPLPDNKKKEIFRMAERLKKREPIQYVIGHTTFCGLAFEVNPSVLIPRPETAELVEWIIRENQQKKLQILDIGTGSGCIAIALKRTLRTEKVVAADLSEKALETARRNAARNQAEITFVCTDILKPGIAEKEIAGSFDVIVSNPPYVTEKEKAHMERNVLDFEPHSALFVPDDDPLLFYRRIAAFGKEKLTPEGTLYFEINAQYGMETVEMLKKEGFRNVELRKDLYENNRMIKARQ